MKYFMLIFALFSYSAFSQTTRTEGVYKIKKGGVVSVETYVEKQIAENKAFELSSECFCQVNVITPDVVFKTTKPKSSSSKKSSSAKYTSSISISSSLVSSSSSSISSSIAPVKTGLLIPVSAIGSTEQDGNLSVYTIDGDENTRWESAWLTDPSSIKIDLGIKNPITKIDISWEASNASDYTIQGSNDDVNYSIISTRTGLGFGERIDENTVSGSYRYLKIVGTARPSDSYWGYSIYEIKVFNEVAISSSSISNSSSSSSLGIAKMVDIAFSRPSLKENGEVLDPNNIVRYELKRSGRVEKINPIGENIIYRTTEPVQGDIFQVATVAIYEGSVEEIYSRFVPVLP